MSIVGVMRRFNVLSILTCWRVGHKITWSSGWMRTTQPTEKERKKREEQNTVPIWASYGSEQVLTTSKNISKAKWGSTNIQRIQISYKSWVQCLHINPNHVSISVENESAPVTDAWRSLLVCFLSLLSQCASDTPSTVPWSLVEQEIFVAAVRQTV